MEANSDKKDKWIYYIKNLLILDCCCELRIKLNDIANLDLICI